MKIGLIGFGDLGQRMALQLTAAGHDIVIYDKASPKLTAEKPVDPNLTINGKLSKKMTFVNSAAKVLGATDLIHYAVPVEAVVELPQVSSHQIVILHDSVMALSRRAIKSRKDKSRFAISHCIMNQSRRIFVASDQPNSQAAVEHFRAIGLDPKLIELDQHDKLMARTQAVCAALINVGLGDVLNRASESGDLTPSAEELHALVANREARWTTNTMESLLSNPQLEVFIRELLCSLRATKS